MQLLWQAFLRTYLLHLSNERRIGMSIDQAFGNGLILLAIVGLGFSILLYIDFQSRKHDKKRS